jgi:hypothetical protein
MLYSRYFICLVCVTTLIPNEYRQSSNSSVSGSQVQDSKTTQNAYCLSVELVRVRSSSDS